MPSYPTGRIFAGYGGLLRRETLDGARVVRAYVYPTNKAGFLPRMTSYLSFCLSAVLVGLWIRPRPDAIIVESPPLFLGVSSMILSRLRRAILVLNVSDLWPESAVCLGVIPPGGLAHRISSALEGFLYRMATIVTGQSRGIVKSIQVRHPMVRTHLMSNGAQLSLFGPQRFDADLQKVLRGNTKCAIVYSGLHGLAQGLAGILDGLTAVEEPDLCRVTFIGDGPEKKKLVERARELNLKNVEFLPPVSHVEVARILSSCDVALVSLGVSLPGAIPSKIYEAMASTKPILFVGDGEAVDVIRRHDVGIVVPARQPRQFAAAVKRLASDAAERERLGRNALKAANEEFDRDKIAATFVEVLEELESVSRKRG
jgi:glycosyltransferase involved in cell wall biosynthesis